MSQNTSGKKPDLSGLSAAVHQQLPFQAYHEVVGALRDFAAALVSDVIKTENIDVTLQHGFKVNQGQQFKLVLTIKPQSYTDVLLRAYVPDGGYPVVLDYVGIEKICPDLPALEAALYSDIGSNADIQSRLRAVIALAKEAV